MSESKYFHSRYTVKLRSRALNGEPAVGEITVDAPDIEQAIQAVKHWMGPYKYDLTAGPSATINDVLAVTRLTDAQATVTAGETCAEAQKASA